MKISDTLAVMKNDNEKLSEDNLIKKFTSGISVKEIGFHLSNFANLYLRPLKSWQQAINYQKSSYHFVILHLIYYTFILFFIIQDVSLAIPIALLEVLVTIIPTLIFILPFLIFRRIGSKHLKWNRLFRLFLVLKFQFGPLILLNYLLAHYTHVEELYIIYDNVIWLIWILFIISMPLLMKIKVWQKLLYIVCNYFFFQLFFVIIFVVFSFFEADSFDSDSEMSEYFPSTPSLEIIDFQSISGNSFDYINFKNFYVKGRFCGPDNFCIEGAQFGTIFLDQAYNIKQINDLIRKQLYHDSLLVILDSTHISKKDDYELYPLKRELTKYKLDSLKNDFDKRFALDLRLAYNLKDSSLFKTNRKYFNNLFQYLTEYKIPFENTNIINEIFKNDSLKSFVVLKDSTLVFQYLIDKKRYSSRFYESRTNLNELEIKFERRDKVSSFSMEILLYPWIKLTDYYYEIE